MSETELPEGWAWASLGEIATSVKNGIYVSRPGAAPDGVPILRISAVRPMNLSTADLRYTGLALDEIEAKDGIARPGDLLFTRYNGNINLVGACARVPDHAPTVAYPDKLIRVTLPDEIDSRFLCYVWSWAETQVQLRQHVKTTAGQAGISGSSLKAMRLPIAPRAEQHRIVEALEDHLSRLDAAEGLIKATLSRSHRLSDKITATTHGYLVADDLPAASPPPPAGTDDGRLPNLRPTWSWKRLDEIADVVGGVTKDKKKQSDLTYPEVPYLRVANVQRGRLDLSEVALIRVPEKKAAQLVLQRGDVLLNEGGDRDKLGRGWVWEDQVPGAIHQNHVFRARIRGNTIHPKLLSWYANGMARWFEANGNQSVNLASISLSKIKKLPVPVPPVGEQQAIVERIEGQLSLLENASSLSRQALSKAGALRRSLLNRAFTGRLVPQDPADEPASVLLDRIRAEREAQGGKPKRTRRAVPKQSPAGPAPAAKANPIPSDAVQLEF